MEIKPVEVINNINEEVEIVDKTEDVQQEENEKASTLPSVKPSDNSETIDKTKTESTTDSEVETKVKTISTESSSTSFITESTSEFSIDNEIIGGPEDSQEKLPSLDSEVTSTVRTATSQTSSVSSIDNEILDDDPSSEIDSTDIKPESITSTTAPSVEEDQSLPQSFTTESIEKSTQKVIPEVPSSNDNEIKVDEKQSLLESSSTKPSIAPNEVLQSSTTEDSVRVTESASTDSRLETTFSAESAIQDTTTRSTTVTQSTTTVTTAETTTTTAAPFFSSGVLSRVRDLVVALVAGLIAQTVGFPFSPAAPARKDAAEGQFIKTGQRPTPPSFNVRDPFIRNKYKESEGAFDGSIFNFTIPLTPEEVVELKQDDVKKNISSIVVEAFGPQAADAVKNITFTLGDKLDQEDNGKIIINAQASPVYDPKVDSIPLVIPPREDIRPKTPRLEDSSTPRVPPSIDLPSFTPSPTNIIFPAKDDPPSIARTENPYFIPPFVPKTTLRTTTIQPPPSTRRSSTTQLPLRLPSTTRRPPPTIFRSTSEPRFIPAVDSSTISSTSTVRFELEDALPTRRTTVPPPPPPIRSTTAPDNIQDLLDGYESYETDLFPPVPIYPFPPRDDEDVPPYDEGEYILDSFPVDDNKVFDRRLNFLGK